MKKSLTKVALSSAVVVVVGSLAACGGNSDNSRNRNSAPEVAPCLDAASATVIDSVIRIPTCAAATKWAFAEADGTVGELSDISNGAISVSARGTAPGAIKTFDVDGNEVGFDDVKINGSRGGYIYFVDERPDRPVFFEAALPGWADEERDPPVKQTSIDDIIESFNNSLTPAGDWSVGSEQDMQTLLAKRVVVDDLQLSKLGSYWTSIQPGNQFRSTISHRKVRLNEGAQEASSPETVARIRPIRTFDSGAEPILVITSLFSPANVVNEGSSSTDAPTSSEVPSSTEALPTSEDGEPTTDSKLSTEEQTAAQILSPVDDVVNVSDGQKTIMITPDVIESLLSDSTFGTLASLEVSFDGKTWTPVSLTAETQVVVPENATGMQTRLKNDNNETLVTEKSIVRGEKAVSPSSSSSTSTTVASTSTDDLPDEDVAAAEPNDSDNSLSILLFGGLGALVLVIFIWLALQRRRLKK